MALAAVAHFGVFASLPAAFKEDREIAWAAVSRYGGQTIKHAAPSLQADRSFMLMVVSQGVAAVALNPDWAGTGR